MNKELVYEYILSIDKELMKNVNNKHAKKEAYQINLDNFDLLD